MLKDPIPPGECDLVMKGGITSGIVYPPTLLELQKHYKFRSIGGTSAGAIAAVAAAAAEYNRDGIGFSKLERVQEWLSTDGNLRNLFQASAETKPLFDVLIAVLEAQGPENKRTTADPATQSTGQAAPKGNEPTSKHLFLRILTMFPKGLAPSLPPTVLPIVDGLIDTWTLAKEPYLPYKRGGNVGMSFGILSGIALVLVLLGVALVVLGIVSLFVPAIEARILLILLAAGVLLSVLFGLIFGWIGTWLGRVVGVALDLRNVFFTQVPENFYGVCTGHTMEGATANLPYGTNLTDWLSDLLDTIAGLPNTTSPSPLTFGQLKEKQIDLKMVTSNLSHGQPYVLPEGLENFMFNATEMRKLFPSYVVDHMIKFPPSPSADPANAVISREKLPQDYHLLPDKDHLPVVVGTRLSLSFPLLLSALPFYTLSASAYNARNSIGVFDPKEHFQKNWFSDGGICNNFPIEFFDAWLPSRPTFGINLTSMPTDATTSVIVAPRPGQQSVNTTEDVYLPRAEDRLDPQWTDIDGAPAVLKLVTFLMQIFGTAQNYRDTLQSNLPSYRERIVQIRLGEQEGGLNLTVPTEIIDRMVNKGKMAGNVLCPTNADRADPEKLQTKFNFDHHWWVRFLVVMAQLEQNVENLEGVFDDPDFQSRLDGQLTSKDSSPPYPYWRDEAWCKEAKDRITELRTLIDCWKNAPQQGRSSEFFRTNAPLPDPVLRVTLEV
jgi:Patatin-like phospholipase